MPWEQRTGFLADQSYFLDLEDACETQNVLQDRYDYRIFDDLLKESAELRDLSWDTASKTWPALLQDIFADYYKAAPELVPEEEVALSHRTNRRYVEKLMQDPATEQARTVTMLDELSSALATLEAGKKLAEEIGSRQELREALSKADQAAQAEEEGNKEEAEVLATQSQQQLQSHARDLFRAVREASEAGKEKANELEQALASWGLEAAGLKQVPLGERLKVAQRLMTPQMKRLSDLIGRMRNLARARQKQKLKHQRDELHSITLGADLPHLLPTELASIRHPLRKLDFYRRFTEKQLLQYELLAREPQGRGPIICLVDCSGSMGEAIGGLTKMDWATAVALGLVDTAIRQRRQVVVIHFNAQIVREIEFVLGRERNVKDFLAVASVGTNGGTDYMPPFTRAAVLLRSSPYQKGDIALITDGVYRLPDYYCRHFLADKKAKEARLFSVLIGDSQGKQELARYSDKVWSIRQLGEEAAGEIFEEVL